MSTDREEEIPMRERNPQPDDNETNPDDTQETNVDETQDSSPDDTQDPENVNPIGDFDKTNTSTPKPGKALRAKGSPKSDPNVSIPIVGGSGHVADEFIEMEILDFVGTDEERERKFLNIRGLRILEEIKSREIALETVNDGFRFRSKYGPNSKKLLESIRMKKNKDGITTGVEFADPDVNKKNKQFTPVIVGVSDGRVRYTNAKSNKTDKFKQLVEKAKNEYEKSVDNQIDRAISEDQPPQYGSDADKSNEPIMPQNVVDDISENVVDEIFNRRDEVADETLKFIDDYFDRIGETERSEGSRRRSEKPKLSENQKRVIERILEFRGNLPPVAVGGETWRDIDGVLRTAPKKSGDSNDPYNVEGHKANAEHFEKLYNEETDPELKNLYKGVARVAELNVDMANAMSNKELETTEGKEILKEKTENSDLTRLERFKRWAKENMVGLSAIAISSAGLITGIIMATRKAMTMGACGIGKFERAVAKVFKKLGPLFSAIGSLISTVLSMGTKGILWLANNLWVLAIAITIAIYQEYRNKRRRTE